MIVHGHKEKVLNYESVKLKILVLLIYNVFVRIPYIISNKKYFNFGCRWCRRFYVLLRMSMAKHRKIFIRSVDVSFVEF